MLPEGRRRPLLLGACAQASPSARSVCQYSVWTSSILNADTKDVDLAAAVIVCVANWLSIKCTQHSYVSLYSAAYLEHIRLVCRTNILASARSEGFTSELMRIRVSWHVTVPSLWIKALIPSRTDTKFLKLWGVVVLYFYFMNTSTLTLFIINRF